MVVVFLGMTMVMVMMMTAMMMMRRIMMMIAWGQGAPKEEEERKTVTFSTGGGELDVERKEGEGEEAERVRKDEEASDEGSARLVAGGKEEEEVEKRGMSEKEATEKRGTADGEEVEGAKGEVGEREEEGRERTAAQAAGVQEDATDQGGMLREEEEGTCMVEHSHQAASTSSMVKSQVSSAICLRGAYAKSGTDIAYGARQRTQRAVRHVAASKARGYRERGGRRRSMEMIEDVCD
eukprot:3907154-Rhodomonas_salina.1